MNTSEQYLQRTETAFYVGSAWRLATGQVKTYHIGKTEYKTLEAAQSYIDSLYYNYKLRGIDMPIDEFIPVGVTKIEYLPAPF